MEMNRKALLELLEKYNKGIATEEEIAFLEAYYKLFDLNADGLENMLSADKQELKESIKRHLHQNISTEAKIPKVNLFHWKWAAAAAIFIACSFTFLFLITSNNEGASNLNVKNSVDAPVVPGSNQATLTLANGTKILLNNKGKGTVSNQNGVIISKDDDGLLTYKITDNAIVSIDTMTTPLGGQYQLILSDGTKVWLNADTRITFPTKFEGDERVVNIVGEAYFEVAENKLKPFKVYTQDKVVEVLGTHFNVNSYADDGTARTTLLEGSVKVTLLDIDAPAKILKPGQTALLSKSNNKLSVFEADTESAVAWKNGYFKFKDTDMRSLMSQVARWYDVDVEYRGEVSKDLFGGKLKRSDNIEEILRILQLSNINARLEGRTIIISNKP